MNPEQLEAFLAEIQARMEAIQDGLEGRSELNDDETAEWAQLREWVQAAEAAQARHAEIAELAARTRPVAGTHTAPAVNVRDEADVWEVRAGDNAGAVRAQALTAIESLRGTSDEVREALTNFVETGDNRRGDGARHVIATASPQYRDAWRTALLDDPMFLTDAQRNTLAQARSITLTSGFAFPSTVDPTVLHIGSGSTNPFRQMATVRQVVTKDHDVNTLGAITASMDAEAAEVSDDTPADATVNIATKKAQAFAQFSIESEQDLASLEADLRMALVEAKDDLEAAQMAVGTGSGNNVQGVMVGATTTVNSAGSGAFALADVYALVDALPPKHDMRASWLANKATYNKIRQFDTAGGAALWERLGAGTPAQLLGAPVYEASSVVSAVSSGNEILAYGNFAQGYRVVDRVGMSVERIQLMLGANNRPDGTRGLYAYWRFGAGVTDANALRVLTIAA